MTQPERDIKRKLTVLKHAEESGNVAQTARRFGISRQCYYKWKHAYVGCPPISVPAPVLVSPR